MKARLQTALVDRITLTRSWFAKGDKWLIEDLRSYVVRPTYAANKESAPAAKKESAPTAKKEPAQPEK